MALISKIRALCDYNNLSITRLESVLGYGHGAITRASADSLRAEKIREIAEYFDVTPTYLMSDMKFCVCPVCAVAYNPLDEDDKESHRVLHDNYISLRDKYGYLLNPSQAATKRSIAKAYLEDPNHPDEGKVFHYETLVQCDFAEYSFSNDFVVETAYSDFIKEEIRERKYFELIPQSVIKNLTVKYNVDLNSDDTPLIDLFQSDKEFMSNITDLWDLPQSLRYDVYKAIRHAKRDYADKEYYTNPYANVSKHCHDNYDPDSEKCQNCRKE